ncbi:hypothetical protein FRC12_019137 [Ceratobasidium sp. 428]|nr:hypothetical protein FRC12_019137 [Ceratobasidium sp. 428]
MYGNWHAQAAKLRGLDDPETVRLGNIFTTCLDGQKTGLSLQNSILGTDSRNWNEVDGQLRRKLTVIEDLKDALDQYRKDSELALATMKPYNHYDKELTAPYKKEVALCDRIPGLEAELDVITTFVDHMRTEYETGQFSVFKRYGKPRFDRTGPGGKKERGKTHSQGEKQEAERAASEAFNRDMPKGFTHIRDCLVPRVAASYAYSNDAPINPKFTFAVAWDELCKIKAEAKGGTRAIIPEIGDKLSMARRMREQVDLVNEIDN